MGDFGIGAAVRRTGEFRFLTGQGTYTDDINRPGQLHAFLLRSPHAHAELGAIDTAAAKTAPGVCCGLHRRRCASRQPTLRLARHLEGRQADGRAAASTARPGQGAPCG